MPVNPRCSVEGNECAPTGGPISLGLCSRHYARFNRYGEPTAGRIPHQRRRDFYEYALTYDGDDCLLWPFKVGEHGYAVLSGKRVHRMVLEATQGPPPEPDWHACHAPGIGCQRHCINPKHLRWGSPRDNRLDRVIDGTHNLGLWTTVRTPTREEAIEIIPSRDTYAALAKRFDTTRRKISQIKHGHLYPDLDRSNVHIRKTGRPKGSSTKGVNLKVTEEQERLIILSPKSGVEMAKETGLSEATISRVRSQALQNGIGKHRKKNRLTLDQATRIFWSEGTNAYLGRLFGVSHTSIHHIKAAKVWPEIDRRNRPDWLDTEPWRGAPDDAGGVAAMAEAVYAPRTQDLGD